MQKVNGKYRKQFKKLISPGFADQIASSEKIILFKQDRQNAGLFLI